MRPYKHIRKDRREMTTSSGTRSPSSGSSKRTLTLRICFIASLTAAAMVCGIVAHKVITNLEQDVGDQTYESVAASALENAQAIFQRKLQAGFVMASILGQAFPNGSQWPFVALEGYETIAQQLANLSVSVSHMLSVIVQPEQAADFEAFARRVYREHGYPETAGYNDDLGFGIWKIEEDEQGNSPSTSSSFSTLSNKRVRDTNGTSSHGSPWTILAPIFLNSNRSSTALLYNIHSPSAQGSAIDWMRTCANEHAAMATKTIATMNAPPACNVVTDFTEQLGPTGPVGVILQPVYPLNDHTNMVAVVGTSLQWENVLTSVVPDYVDGLHCVIASETATYTFVIQHGVPILIGEGDLHDRDFDRLARNVTLHDLKSTSARSATYTLTVYPTSRMFDVFQTNSPQVVSVGFVSIILVCIALFCAYDRLMKYEARQRRQLLDLKRRFVRFISHEIRTPLNCVSMGLEILQDDLRQHIFHHHHPHRNSLGDGRNSVDDSNRRKSMDGDSHINRKMGPTEPTLNICKEQNNNDSGLSDKEAVMRDQKQSIDTSLNQLEGPSLSLSQYRSCVPFMQSCLELTGDIYENTKNAVAVLDDLLNYDKIQTGTLKLEVTKVQIWDMVRKTVLQFKLQAQNKRLQLHTYIDTGSSSYHSKTHSQHDDDDDDGVPEQNDEESDSDFVEESGEFGSSRDINALGDDLKLSQALRNLISNALKFTCEGGTVTVSASYKRDGLPKAKRLADAASAAYPRSGSVCISVHDTGAGMSADQLKLLFQEWVQFDANKLQKGGGSGLGLCITKEIVEQHGGIIAAESAGLGKGATFTVELPLYEFPRTVEHNRKKHASGLISHEGEGVEGSVGATESTAPTTDIIVLRAPPRLVQHRILVVEDVISNCKLLVRLLERGGHTCDVATNGQEAIDCYLADQAAASAAAAAPTDPITSNARHVLYDTILMDSEMPVLTGPQATKQLRELGCTAAIIGITGNVLPADVQYFKSHGADEVLPKPVEITLIEDFWANHNCFQR